MFNKIKNFFKAMRFKKFIKKVENKISEKSNQLYFKAQNAVAAAKAEFYIDKTVGIIIAVVVGALLLGIVYTFIKTNVQTQLNSKITDMWGYTG